MQVLLAFGVGIGLSRIVLGVHWATDVLAGLAVGAGSQLVLIRVVYLPLEALWPGTFTEDRLTENAQDLVDRAGGASTLLLFAVAFAFGLAT